MSVPIWEHDSFHSLAKVSETIDSASGIWQLLVSSLKNLVIFLSLEGDLGFII